MAATKRRGQTGIARRAAAPKPPPGAAVGDPRQQPDFVKWLTQYGDHNSTYPEYLIFRRLERDGYRVGMEFSYLGYEASVYTKGYQQVDFIVLSYLAWAVNGVYFHFQRDPTIRQRDAVNRAVLEGEGFTVVEMLDVDIIERLEPTYRLALNGTEMPGARTGVAA